MYLNRDRVRGLIERALEEDIGHGDLSSSSLFSESEQAQAVILAKQDGVLAGLPVAEMVFRSKDPNLTWSPSLQDGQEFARGREIVQLQGSVLAILMCERLALNFLQRMSGLATLTRKFVQAIEGFPVRMLD